MVLWLFERDPKPGLNHARGQALTRPSLKYQAFLKTFL